ncbi:MAG: thioredoxin domain-containing protein [Bacteroidia bacterium]|nr:thioredoxin domain-containing protein [Bacteroidia bacterium]
MKRIAISISFVLISLFVISQNAVIRQVSPIQFSELIKNPSGVLLDVRTQSEFSNGHIANSGQLNYYSLDFRKNLLLLPKDEPIYLYCNTGYRSQKAADILTENGYQNVYNLEHGIMDWELKNLPVVVDPDARPDTDNKMDFSEYAKLIQSKELVFIDFYAPWCSPCRKMMPMMDSLKVDYHGSINIVKVNVDASKSLVKALRLVGVPYLVIYKNGKLLYSNNGAVTRNEITSVFQSNLAKN